VVPPVGTPGPVAPVAPVLPVAPVGPVAPFAESSVQYTVPPVGCPGYGPVDPISILRYHVWPSYVATSPTVYTVDEE